jgi:hypothetical protein
MRVEAKEKIRCGWPSFSSTLLSFEILCLETLLRLGCKEKSKLLPALKGNRKSVLVLGSTVGEQTNTHEA